uniref:Uncharacterized protein n=1 Tax=Anguilla anguilla TaxID=7936 RepID=A0A0E9TDN5_ANGAN
MGGHRGQAETEEERDRGQSIKATQLENLLQSSSIQ